MICFLSMFGMKYVQLLIRTKERVEEILFLLSVLFAKLQVSILNGFVAAGAARDSKCEAC